VYVNTLNPHTYLCVFSGGFTASDYDWVNGFPQIHSPLYQSYNWWYSYHWTLSCT